MRTISELRQDLVTGDWVVVATGRARRPDEFARRGPKRVFRSPARCPFERLMPTALLVYDRSGERFHLTPKNRAHLRQEWWLQVVPNKYPAFGQGRYGVTRKAGPYRWQDGVGFHEVVITRDHTRAISTMSEGEVEIVLRAYRNRFLALKDEDCVEYISIFHNHGPESGATVTHPHSQIIAIPVVPPDIGRSLRGSSEYFHKHRRCVHCAMIDFEKRTAERVVYRNRDFIVFCPFISRQAFEVRIFPLRHNPEFERTTDDEMVTAADALRTALAKIDRGLGDPDYNFFIHTAPTSDGRRTPHYHWHVEIIPKTATWAGFEIGTGIEISTIAPEVAARFLKNVSV